ncbi:MAG: hypothetical protein KF784_14255 [Fimbriimonadaceae bacterium]|nr:hypothetical protein [Fimbriimonadaceae bacterium]
MDNDSGSVFAIMSVGMWFGLFILVYVVQAVALMTIANKTGTENSWMAWIPILNVLLMLSIAGLDWWYILIMLIPCVGWLVVLYAWWLICEERGKPGWISLLQLVPCIGFFVPLYVAFVD